MTDRTTTTANGRAVRANLSPVGVSGVVAYGGVLMHDDSDRAWVGSQRDKTIRSMLNDPVLGAVLLGIEMLVRRVEWRVDPADDTPAAAEAAEFVSGCLDDMAGHWPGDTLAQVLTFLGWGWSCLEVVHKQRKGPTGKPPSRFDDGRIGWRKWSLRPQPTRYGWRFGDDGEPTGMIQQDPVTFKLIDIPLARCLTFRYGSRDNSPEGSTALRMAYDAWYNKRAIQRIEAIGIERELAGLPVMYIPGANIEAADAVYTAAQQIVTGLRQDSQSGAVVAGDRDDKGNRIQELTLLTTGGARAIDTDPVIRRYANEMVTVFLANVLRTGQDNVGAFALSETQSGLFQQAIGAHLDTVADTLTNQAVWPLWRLNGGQPETSPLIRHGDIESAGMAEMGQLLKDLADSGLLYPSPELTHFAHSNFGLPVPSVEDIEAEMAEREAKAQEMQRQIAEQGANDGDEPAAEGGAANQGPTRLPVAAGEEGFIGELFLPPDWREGKTKEFVRVPAESREMPPQVRALVEEDGSLTLSDLTAIVAWWDKKVPGHAGMLNAKLVGEGEL